MDLVRDLLLRIEGLDIPATAKAVLAGYDPEMQFEGFSADDVEGHLRLLIDGGLLTGPFQASITPIGELWLKSRIT